MRLESPVGSIVSTLPVILIMVTQCLEKRNTNFGYGFIVGREKIKIIPNQITYSNSMYGCFTHAFYYLAGIRHRGFHHLCHIFFILYLRVGPNNKVMFFIILFQRLKVEI
ncbi:hypothetical protein D3C87_368640 [compost metagenome]